MNKSGCEHVLACMKRRTQELWRPTRPLGHEYGCETLLQGPSEKTRQIRAGNGTEQNQNYSVQPFPSEQEKRPHLYIPWF